MKFAERLAAEPRTTIQGVECLSTTQIARLLGFSRETVNRLVRDGNKYGKLPSMHRVGFSKWGFLNLVPVEALFTFTFAEGGPYGRPYRFTPEGKKQYMLDIPVMQDERKR